VAVDTSVIGCTSTASPGRSTATRLADEGREGSGPRAFDQVPVHTALVEVGVHGLAQLSGRAFHSGTFGKAEGEVLAVPVILGLQPYERPMLFAIEKPVLPVDQVEATVVHHPVVGELEFLVVVESGPLHRRGR